MRLLRRILSFSFIVIIALSIVRGYHEYIETIDTVHESMVNIERTHAQSMTESLWDYDTNQISLYLSGILHIHHISYCSVRVGDNIIAENGTRRFGDMLTKEIDLTKTYRNIPRLLGTLTIQADLVSVRKEIYDKIIVNSIFSAAVILAVALLAFLLTRQMISRHLSAIAMHFGALEMDTPPPPLKLNKKNVGDELDVLAEAIGTMQTRLVKSFVQIKAAQLEAKSLSGFPQENPSPVLRADGDGYLLTANPASESLLRHLRIQVGDKLPEEFVRPIVLALETNEVQTFETCFDNRVIAFVARHLSWGKLVNLYGMDITRRVQAEEEVRRNVTRLQSVVRLLQHDKPSVQDLLDLCLKEALTLTESHLGYIFLHKEKNSEFTLCTWSGQAGTAEDNRPRAERCSTDTLCIWQETVRRRRPIVLNTPHALQHGMLAYPDEQIELQNALSMPVYYGGSIVAVVGVANRDGDYTDGNVLQLSILMDTCWQVMARITAEQNVMRSLHEKEILLKEIHHRVKNNLQIISSLLFLQSQYVIEPLDQVMFSESQKRISAMALVHEELYSSKDLSSVSMADYVPRLLQRVLTNSNSTVSLKCNIENILLPITESIPCCLLLNELVMNTVKHAFCSATTTENALQVSFLRDEMEYVLSVRDNGPGLPPNFSLDQISSLGMTLIISLAQQLRGSICAENMEKGGACFTLRFPAETA